MSFLIRFCFACSINVRGTSFQFLAFFSVLFHCNHPPINTFIKKSSVQAPGPLHLFWYSLSFGHSAALCRSWVFSALNFKDPIISVQR